MFLDLFQISSELFYSLQKTSSASGREFKLVFLFQPPSVQVVAIVMDLLTDLQILQDLLDASSRRSVAVYIVLEAKGVVNFLDMCSRLQINALHLRVSRKGGGGGVIVQSRAGSCDSCSQRLQLIKGDKKIRGFQIQVTLV